MKKAVLSGLRWGMDAGFFLTISWFFATLLFAGVDSLFFGIREVTEDFFYWCIFPLFFGAISGAIFSFILIKFLPAKIWYIPICIAIGMLPMYPYIFTVLRQGALIELSNNPVSTTHFLLYFLMCILLSNFIYHKNKISIDEKSTSA